MPVQLRVSKANNELLFYSQEIPDDEYDSPTEYRYTLPNTTPDALDIHLQGKVAAGQEVGRIFVVASGAVGNFGGYMFTVNRATVAEGVVAGWVNALGGVLRLPSGLSEIRDVRAVFRNFGESEEYGFASGSFSMLLRVAANRDIIVQNDSNACRFVRVTATGTPVGGGS